MTTPRLSILVPVYNEVGTVKTLLERVMAVPIPKEIIVVDDCSRDGTRDVLSELAASVPDTDMNRLRVFMHERNQGKGAAVRTAVAHARGEITIIQDADLEYDPNEYPKLIQPILDGHADVVFGSRFSGSPRRVLMFWHTVANRFLTLLSNMCTNLNLTDMETCYKVFRTEILQRIPIRSNRFGLEPELTAKVARLRCRVYEVPISYHGRQYAEGKKIGWKDAISAVWTILRFRIVADIGREDAGFTTLRRVEGLHRYNRFMWNLLEPFVGRRILEIGSGTGLMTRYLAARGQLTATDLDAEYVELLARTFAGNPNVEVRQLDLATLGNNGAVGRGYDTVICSNVLEHIEDDARALAAMRDVLAPGGRVVLVVPALKALYGEIDRAIHHHRRYSREEITEKLRGAGLQVEHVSAFNMLGVPGWWLNSVVLRRKAVPGIQARINDRLVPLLRLERLFGPPVGMSLLAVGRVPAR
ncbi:MAG TPA: glycosyltransferase [Candidatus Limnocylindria bacterium]|nr:glycosyltransferase [Candidatus Limnocylindria bacterium]